MSGAHGRSKWMSEWWEQRSERTSMWSSNLRVHFIVILMFVQRFQLPLYRYHHSQQPNIKSDLFSFHPIPGGRNDFFLAARFKWESVACIDHLKHSSHSWQKKSLQKILVLSYKNRSVPYISSFSLIINIIKLVPCFHEQEKLRLSRNFFEYIAICQSSACQGKIL